MLEKELAPVATSLLKDYFVDCQVVCHCANDKQDLRRAREQLLKNPTEESLDNYDTMVQNHAFDLAGRDFSLYPKNTRKSRILYVQFKASTYENFLGGARSIVLGDRDHWQSLGYDYHLHIYGNKDSSSFVFACLVPYPKLRQFIWKLDYLAYINSVLGVQQEDVNKQNKFGIVQENVDQDGKVFDYIHVEDLDPFGGQTCFWWTKEALDNWSSSMIKPRLKGWESLPPKKFTNL